MFGAEVAMLEVEGQIKETEGSLPFLWPYINPSTFQHHHLALKIEIVCFSETLTSDFLFLPLILYKSVHFPASPLTPEERDSMFLRNVDTWLPLSLSLFSWSYTIPAFPSISTLALKMETACFSETLTSDLFSFFPWSYIDPPLSSVAT
jgi:hypothetical protein